jgi:hypothetical protein
MPSINFVLNQIQYDATTFQKCKLICKLIIKMYFFRFHANDDQFNEKLVLPTTLLDQGDSNKNTQISHKQPTLLQSNKRKKTKNAKGKRKRLDQMTSKNQMKRVTDFRCPSLEFSLNRIGEKKARDRFQALNSKNSKIMKKGIKYEQKGVYFSGGSMSEVKRRIIES